MSDQLRETALHEMAYHEAKQVHYQDLIDRLLVNLEYHAKQEDLWTQYLGNLASGGAEVVPFAPPQRHLRLVEGEA